MRTNFIPSELETGAGGTQGALRLGCTPKQGRKAMQPDKHRSGQSGVARDVCGLVRLYHFVSYGGGMMVGTGGGLSKMKMMSPSCAGVIRLPE